MVLGLGGWLKRRGLRARPAEQDAAPDDAAPPAARDPAASARHEGRGVDAAKLVDAVRRLVKDQKGRVAGAIHLINLDVVRQRLGDRWPAVSDRLLAGIEVILDRRLAATDLYIRIEGPSYLIVFGDLDQGTARLKCALIGHEIEKHVFGDDVAEIAVRASVFRLDGGGAGRPEEIDLLGMINALRADADQTIPGERRRQAQGQIAGQATGQGTDPEGGRGGGPAMTAVDHTGPPGNRANYVLVPIYQNATSPPSSFVYRPIWHTRHDAIATYLCQPVWLKSGGIGSSGENYVEYQPAFAGEGDVATLDEICRSFRLLAAERRRGLLSMPVHFETLARSATRKEFMAVAAGLSAAERRLLSFELTGIDETVPQTRLTELVAAIHPFCRGVSLRCGIDRHRFFGIREARVYAVGVEITVGRGAETGIFARMEGFAAAAETAGLRTYAHGLRTRSLTSGAIAAGFHYVDGDPVATPLDRPSNAYRYRLIDLYRRQLDEIKAGSA